VIAEEWAFGETTLPSESIREVRKQIRSARSKKRSTWWYAWRAKRTDRVLERKLEKLTKQEKLLVQARDQHDPCQKALAQIDHDLSRLGENAESVRAALSERLQRWHEPLPDPGGEKLPVDRLRERSELYRLKLRERTAASDELQRLQTQLKAGAEALQRLEAETQHLSAESQTIQSLLNGLKADRQDRYGALDLAGERRTLENQIESLDAEAQSLTMEVEPLRHGLAAELGALQRLADQARQTFTEAEITERDLLEKASAAGFFALNDIRAGLAILQGEQELKNRLFDAEGALTSAREALAALRPKHVTQDSLETVRWKISDAIKRQKILQQEIDGYERSLEQHRQAEREYRDLLQAIAVQEKVHAEAMDAHCSIEGRDDPGSGGKLQRHLLKQLMAETNRHLIELSNRRYTLKPSRENGLGLYIEDALQAKFLRSVKTLSGGESFLVSLCLALGLSEMAGKHRKIESLFLDEGFGVLDDEMLYKVMSALKGLRANGKTVGVVSHVKRLADEIPTQIRLEKGPGGSSLITVVA
jgi:exonuclease SbcC